VEDYRQVLWWAGGDVNGLKDMQALSANATHWHWHWHWDTGYSGFGEHMVSSLVRYSMTGAGMTVAIYFAYWGVTALSVTPVLAIALVYPGAVVASYFVNRGFAFRSGRGHREATWRFLLVHTVGYLLNLGLLTLFTIVWSFNHYVVEALVLVLVGGVLFLGLRFFVFPLSSQKR
jgi:putative flippase GtrA